jgi:type IV pilus assembly protein PilY1
MKTSSLLRAAGLLGLAAALHPFAFAQLVINDTLNGASSSYPWAAKNGACLTAGNGTGTIPACVGLSYYSGTTQVGGTTGRLPDTVGNGALRLTNGDTTTGTNGNNETGAVVSNFTFPTNQGLQVTFKTVTYGGNAYANSKGVKSGADGISFFLSDGAQAPSVGALGGSLGYSCSNGNSTYDGVIGGYIGIGIDEFGNFTNKSDNTNSVGGGSTGSSGTQNPGQIAMRGAGNTAWASLTALNPTYYPPTLSSANQAAAVHNTCATGKLWNYSGGQITDKTGAKINNQSATNETLTYNYPILAASTLPSTVNLFSQEATNMPLRGNATPITYALTLTQDGYLDFSYSINGGTPQPVLNHTLITASNGPLPSSFRFGFSAGTGGGSNVHEITCFKAAPATAANNSATTNVQQSGPVQAGTQVYFAYYHPLNSWGQLTATSLLTDALGNVTFKSLSNWDASCVLTGGACQATGAASTTAQAPSARQMLTWSGSAGIPFEWSSLSTAQQTALTAGDSSSTDLRLRYLRGDRTNEVAGTGTPHTLRTRTGVLGDIIDSGPTWVGGATTASYATATFQDKRVSTDVAFEPVGSYASYTSSKATRENVVYVGANDGFLHAFRAGYFDTSGNFQGSGSPPNDGLEVLAYMPGAILSTIHSSTAALDFSGTQYSHNYYVDATPGVGDLYYAGAWHTWLVGGAGFGGNPSGPVGDSATVANGVMFALDVTDPTKFSEANAASLVLGEWATTTTTTGVTTSTLSCVTGGGGASCGSNLGSSVGTPQIRRLHNGNWAVLFGNGLNSPSGKAGLFIMLVDPATGARTFRYLDTGVGTTGGVKNGIAYVAAADLDGDHITDYVYAGDVLGNVWRFDLTGADPTTWAVGASPLFTTASGQPITTQITGASVPPTTTGGLPRLVLAFGTGRQFPQTLTSAATYATGVQALYGIWDWNMAAWNASAPVGSQYASLTAPQTVTASSLVTQTATTVANSGTSAVSGGYRTVTSLPICWSGTGSCVGTAAKFGWTLALPASTEQVIYNPVYTSGIFLVNTTIPAVSQTLSCDVQPASGFTMAISLASGAAPTQSFFTDANNNVLTTSTGAVVAGAGLSGTGSPSLVVAKTSKGTLRQSIVMPTTGGGATSIGGGTVGTGLGTQFNWKQLR